MPTPLDFFSDVLALQAKVDLDLPKFELLLSATKDSLRQAISSSEEGIPFGLIQSGVKGSNTPKTAEGFWLLRKVILISLPVKITLPLGYFSFLV